MADYKNLKASDGTGNAVLATITNNRAVSGTILEVTSVENWPNEFIVMTGTLDANGYIEAASATEMKAHLTGTDIEIDSFEPGYTDVGNTSGQVAIIKMTTGWADDIIELAQVSHNDDGTLKDNIVTPIKQSNPYYFRAYSISQSFTAGVYKSVIYQNVVADPNSDYDSSTGEYTAPVTGLYQLHASCYWGSSNQKVGTFAINGVNDTTTGTTAMEVTTMGLCRVTDQIQLTAGDKVTAWFRNAATETIIADKRGSNFSGHLITQTA